MSQIRRLHFSAATDGNQRKNGKKNPEQKYFHLVAALEAITETGLVADVVKHYSDRVSLHLTPRSKTHCK